MDELIAEVLPDDWDVDDELLVCPHGHVIELDGQMPRRVCVAAAPTRPDLNGGIPVRLDPAALPKLPYEGRYDGTGYDWMENVADSRTGWHPVPDWGLDGWNLGRWPYVIVCHYDAPGRYGLAVYCEGDLDVRAYDTQAERDADTDRIAHLYWRNYRSGPDDLPATPEDMRPHHRGAFSFPRLDRQERR